jgi:hypothetical protein
MHLLFAAIVELLLTIVAKHVSSELFGRLHRGIVREHDRRTIKAREYFVHGFAEKMAALKVFFEQAELTNAPFHSRYSFHDRCDQYYDVAVD